MSEELKQSALDVVSQPTNAATVSAATIATGVSTALEILPPLLGIVASFTGIIVTLLLSRNYLKKWRLMDLEEKIKLKQLKDE